MNSALLQNTVTNLLKKTDKEQKQLLRHFTKMPPESKMKVMGIKREIFHPLRQNNQGIDLSILSYVSLILSIEKYQVGSSDLDKNVIEIRSNSFPKHPKKNKLLNKWALVKELKEEKDLSFRQISEYLKKYHKLSIAHSTIYELWQELENIKGITNDKR